MILILNRIFDIPQKKNFIVNTKKLETIEKEYNNSTFKYF